MAKWRGTVQFFCSEVPDTPMPILSWTHSESRGEATEWSVELDNKTGSFAPGADPDDPENPWAGLLDCDPTTNDSPQEVKRYFWFEWTINGVLTKSTRLLQTEYQSDDNPKESKVTIGGTDYTELWCDEDQLMADVDAHIAVESSTAAIEATATFCGAVVNFDESFVSWYVPMLHRVGTPLDWLRDLLEVRQGWFLHDDDGIMQIYAGGVDFSEAEVDHEIIERERLKVVRYRKSAQGIKNSGICQRVQEQNDVTPDGGSRTTGLGETDFTFDPATMVVLDIKCWGGSAEVMQFYDADDNPLSLIVTGPHYFGTTPAVKCRFNLIPLTPGEAFEYEIHIRVTPPRPEEFGPFEEEFESSYTDSADSAAYKVKPYPEPFVKECIDTQATGQDFIERKVREGLLNFAQVELSMLWDPTIRPGQFLSVTCKQAALDEHKLLVERRNGSGNSKEMVMTLECSRPRVVETP